LGAAAAVVTGGTAGGTAVMFHSFAPFAFSLIIAYPAGERKGKS
jgi:hypothetical protein